MKNNYIFILFLIICNSFSAQENAIDKEGLLKREAANYNKMTTFNNNPNTTNYDLKYQRLDLDLDPALYQISGSVTSHFLPNQSMSNIYFDLSTDMVVSQVSFHGNNLTFQQLPTKELKINFASALAANVLDSLTINYSGAPNPSADAFRTGSQSSVAVSSTLSEPYGAQEWFPTKQSMDDKIDKMDFKITTPNIYSVAANGKFMNETAVVGNKKRTFWRTQYPMPAYLAAFSITNFTKLNDVIGNPPFPFVNYVYPSTINNSSVMSNIEWTKQAMTTFETYFGAYPFRNEKYGHMEYNYGGVCMEHQTMSSMSSWGKSVIAHELAHQWFGDKVTCGAWNDIWLNEGFATFGEHLVNEKLLMTNAEFLNYLSGQKSYITSSTGGSTYVADSNLSNIGAIFSGRLSYAKGGYILRMLKWVLGDTAFYQALQDYHNRPNLAYNYARTADLTNSLQLSTNINFTEFFNDWLYGQGYPTYDIKYKQSTANQSVTFKVSQTQSNSSVSFFEMPLPIRLNGANGETLLVRLENTTNNQFFNIPCTFTVTSVDFNYDFQMLERNSTVAFDTNLQTIEPIEIIKSDIVLYPSFATNEINFKGVDKVSPYKIYFTDGKLVKSDLYQPEKSINISNFIPGTYIISIADRNFKFIKK
ncbi:M1 family aminopeptidase [Frigoriflavimonas asaccharolytica]|uniref:Aminopeptidase N n=1 Tax=Frigoriflavimonas asaccharolytica TaxID=2735899 RepID=A0A8J8G743_9FLAO|nr:M1 family aminopeptidase [Frigoriflavimonas asaccharolytica]NRS91910.1 aminopeptidase N [Frigoriflavimonas asaccharolytica]